MKFLRRAKDVEPDDDEASIKTLLNRLEEVMPAPPPGASEDARATVHRLPNDPLDWRAYIAPSNPGLLPVPVRERHLMLEEPGDAEFLDLPEPWYHRGAPLFCAGLAASLAISIPVIWLLSGPLALRRTAEPPLVIEATAPRSSETITTLATARPPEAAISKEPPRALNTEVEPAPSAAPMPRAPPVADIKPVPKEQALIEPAPVKEAPPSTAPVAKPVPPRESVPPNEPPPVLSEPPVIAAPLAPAVKPEAPPPPPPVAPAPVLKIAPAPAPLPPKPTPVIVLPPPPVIQLPPRNNVRAGDRVPIAIRVQPAGALVEMQSVVVSGLPTQMAIENATRNGLGAWVLTPAALSDALIVIPPATAAGEIELTYELIGPEGRSVASARTLLVITQPPPVVVAQPAPLVVTPPAPVRRAESEEMLAMLKRGRDMLEQGDIAGARLFFLRAGEGGSADGAFLLAETYDPEVLEQRRVVGGVAPDLAQARQWYMRALTLGSREAEARLQKLPAQ